jgi:YggT family protein
VDVICQAVDLYALVIVARAISSFFPVSPSSPFATVVDVLYRLTEPVFAPVRRVLPPMGGLDLSPLVVLLVIQMFVPRLLGC